MENETIDGKLLFDKNAITNGRDVDAISSVLTEYGYDAETMNSGMALYETADALHVKQKLEYGEQYAASDEFRIARAALNKTYMRHIKLARIALKGNKATEEALQLSGDRKQAFPGWLQQAKTFYTNSLLSPIVLAELAKVNIPQEALTAASLELVELEKKYNKQLKEKGEAQDATEKRDEALDALQDWMSDYIGIARVALEDDPQLLEMLGIVEPS
ncbi:hypothetical protein N6H18_14930 [Reichenbachiella agarivorans]|uniref:Uncharacterized protein n=1 Tax=Reichenbachiella agarivorans TaxID=2979464 RepID=A0ABY6CMB4_9BACT|nr:hypothetical protein [Reichenbachiella agarivorans]UXP31641.1 hypothetical protein N6H18_14930 [Reichenbachiella agarivorans]